MSRAKGNDSGEWELRRRGFSTAGKLGKQCESLVGLVFRWLGGSRAKGLMPLLRQLGEDCRRQEGHAVWISSTCLYEMCQGSITAVLTTSPELQSELVPSNVWSKVPSQHVYQGLTQLWSRASACVVRKSCLNHATATLLIWFCLAGHQ